MARKDRLTRVAVKIGSAMGRADRKAHQIAKAGVLAKKELVDISRQVDALKRQLQKSTRRLMGALSASPNAPVKSNKNQSQPSKRK